MIGPCASWAVFACVNTFSSSLIRPLASTARFALRLKGLVRVGTNPAEEASVGIGVLVRAGSAATGAGAYGAIVKVAI